MSDSRSVCVWMDYDRVAYKMEVELAIKTDYGTHFYFAYVS